MEMNELQAILHFLFLDEVERFEQLAGGQAELAGVASALLPLPASRRSQLDADADIGAHVQLLGYLGYQPQLVLLLYHQEDALAHLLRQQSQLDIAFILVPVADD